MFYIHTPDCVYYFFKQVIIAFHLWLKHRLLGLYTSVRFYPSWAALFPAEILKSTLDIVMAQVTLEGCAPALPCGYFVCRTSWDGCALCCYGILYMQIILPCMSTEHVSANLPCIISPQIRKFAVDLCLKPSESLIWGLSHTFMVKYMPLCYLQLNLLLIFYWL